MGRKTLYNKYDAYNEKGGELGDETYRLAQELIDEWSEKGYRVSEIELIFLSSVSMAAAFIRARNALTMRKKALEKNR